MLTMQVIGNLGGDPEVKETQSGTRLCRFSVASNKKIKGEKVTTWVNVTVFDPHKIDFASNYLRKGAKVFIEGEPQARAYEQNGEARSSLDCVLSFGSKLEICSSEPGENGNGQAAQRTERPAAKKPVATPAWGDDLDDEIPPFD